MDYHNSLFLDTLKDLQEKIDRSTDYDLTKASGLLRHLLIDSPRLIDQVNKKIGMKVRFKISATRDDIPGWLKDVELMWVNLTPDPDSQTAKEEVSVQKFLSKIVLIRKGSVFSVYDFIDVTAHLLGGVHTGNERTPDQAKLKAFGSGFGMANTSTILFNIRIICQIVLDGLQPLKQRVLSL